MIVPGYCYCRSGLRLRRRRHQHPPRALPQGGDNRRSSSTKKRHDQGGAAFSSSSTASDSYSNILCYGTQYDPIISSSSSSIDNVLETSDIIIGIILAFMLAFLASFLQGRRNQNDFVLGEIQPEGEEDVEKDGSRDDSNSTTASSVKIFDGDSWNEVSDPNNYILYQGKLRDRDRIRQEEKKNSTTIPVERTWVLIALLALFLPIFSVEFFFALSRQLICGTAATSTEQLSDFANNLCSPAQMMMLMDV